MIKKEEIIEEKEIEDETLDETLDDPLKEDDEDVPEYDLDEEDLV